MTPEGWDEPQGEQRCHHLRRKDSRRSGAVAEAGGRQKLELSRDSWGALRPVSLGPMVTQEPEKRRHPQMWPWGAPTLEKDPTQNPGKQQPVRQKKIRREGRPGNQGKRCHQAHQVQMAMGLAIRDLVSGEGGGETWGAGSRE